MKALSPFRQGFVGGMTAFLLVTVVFIAGSVAAQPPYDPAKDVDASGKIDVADIQSVAASWGASGSPRGTLHVFSSSTTTNGAAGGRAGMNAICRAEDTASHFCSLHEIENAWMTTGVYFASPFAAAWVDSAKLASNLNSYHEDPAQTLGSNWEGSSPPPQDPRNCYAWRYDSSDWNGYAIWTDATHIGAPPCDWALSVACCK